MQIFQKMRLYVKLVLIFSPSSALHEFHSMSSIMKAEPIHECLKHMHISAKR